MNGVIIIDKPKDYTSFDVIAVLRKKLSQKKIGHMGTLDPMATGVLPILLGETAKFQIFVSDNDKAYIAEMQFGMTTDTLDISGKTLSKTKSAITQEEIEKILINFKGEIDQVPPMFSAIKKNGQKLCDLARRGIDIERESRKINIKFLEIIDFNEKHQTLKINVLCSKGTYIRSLCSDIGDKLGPGATMTSLRRTISNGFLEETSIPLSEIINSTVQEIEKNYVFPTEYLFKNLQSVNVTFAQAIRFKNGGNLMLSRLDTQKNYINDEIYKIFSGNQFIGLGKVCKDSQELKFLKCQSFEME